MRTLLLALSAAAALSACASKPVDGGTAPDVDPRRNITSTVSYGCTDGSVFTVAYLVGDLGAEIHYPNGDVKSLKPAMAASGAKYEGEGVTLWGKGDEATYSAPGKADTLCRVAK
jgi:membrane-bound inhibitor of C-type lysozyme